MRNEMSTKTRKYVIDDQPVDLEKEGVYDVNGQRIDQAYVDKALKEAAQLKPRRGRPSLSGGSVHSPKVSFRIAENLKAKADAQAEELETTTAKLAQAVFEEYLTMSESRKRRRKPVKIR